MKLIILDEMSLNSYDLPSSQDSFIINYKNEILNLSCNSDQWTLLGADNLELIFKGQIVQQVSLNDYDICYTTLKNINKKVLIIPFPSTEKYKACSIGDLSTITIGLTSNNNIMYGDSSIKDTHAIIQKNGNKYTISSSDHAIVYVNDKSITTSELNMGDVIFINGLKIIWMGTFFKINNPHNMININGLQLSTLSFPDASSYTPTTESERTIKLYDESDLFFHTPKQNTYIREEVFEIVTPPHKEQDEQMPLIFTIGTSMVIIASTASSAFNTFRNVAQGRVEKVDAYIQVGMVVIMIISSIILPFAMDRYQKRLIKKKEETRQKKYKEYLDGIRNKIISVIRTQENILNEKHLTLDSICKQILKRGYSLWSREIIDPDFLSIRLGIGNYPAYIKLNATLEQFTLEDDNLKDMVKELVEEKRELSNVPVSISLIDNKVTPIINETKNFYEYINTIMLQLLFYYSSVDLKLVVITNEKNRDKWEYLKYTTHNWSVDRDKRLFAANDTDKNQLSMYIEQLYTQRLHNSSDSDDIIDSSSYSSNEGYKKFNEYYLILTDDYNGIKNLSFVDKVINGKNIGFSMLIFSDSLKNIPSRLDKFVVIREDISGIFDKNVIDGTNIAFKADYLSEKSIRPYANIIANIPVSSSNSISDIPSSIGFLDLFNAGKIEHLNILTRWSTNDPTTSLNAPLGLQSNNRLIGLDLHEKAHGPHGLIAGSTGSGKSEFIMTFILSLAINYHPYEVQFVLIDYKGGGLAGAFEKREKGIRIPHLVGTITNLDKSEMNRTLVSINSELERRQVRFNEAREALDEGTIDIYKYQRLYREGKVSEPMSHLIIICDEFAELKASQPDFMDELVSTARIGRSLGVHLILATQKPSGVVNDQIWSNSRFKICLKVQTGEDSYEVLKRDDASKIKEVGRFYLQVGNDELFELGQSAWSGEKYYPKEVAYAKVNDSIDFLNDEGSIIKTINDDVILNKESQGEQLSNIVDYLYNIAITENISFNNLWLPPLSEYIYLGNLINKYQFKPSRFDFKAVIGEYDKPSQQEQGIFYLDVNNSNTVVFGNPGSGKELLATTFIYSLCVTHNLEELNVYIADFGGGVLKPFDRMPHVGNYISVDETDKMSTLFLFLEKQLRKRKALFADYRGSFEFYNEKSESKVPLIVTVINAYESFMENCGNFDDVLLHLLREGSKYGIVFFVTTIAPNSIRNSVLGFYENKVMLKVQDDFDYRYILNAPGGLIPSDYYGRGIGIMDYDACEFQTAYINVKDEINNTIRDTGNKLLDLYKARVKSIKSIPRVIKFKDFERLTKTITQIPIGYDTETADIVYHNFIERKITTILGEEIFDDISFIGSIIDLIDTINEVNMNIFDISTKISFEGRANYYNSDYLNAFNTILQNNASVPTINVVLAFSDSSKKFNKEEYSRFQGMINNANKLNNQYFILIDDIDKYEDATDSFVSSIVDSKNGIYYGDNIDIQKAYDVNNQNLLDLESNISNKAFLITDGNVITLKGVGNSGDE